MLVLCFYLLYELLQLREQPELRTFEGRRCKELPIALGARGTGANDAAGGAHEAQLSHAAGSSKIAVMLGAFSM